MKKPVTIINSGLAELNFHTALARQLSQRGHDVHAVTMGSRYTNLYKQTGCYEHVTDLAVWMRDHWESDRDALMREATRIEQAYGPPGLWQWLAADRRICRRDHDFNLRAACSQVAFWERHLSEMQPAIVVGEVSHLHNALPWAVGRRFGVPFAHLIPARIRGHTAIGDGPMEHENIVALNYGKFREEGAPAGYLQQARDYLEAFRAQAERAPHTPPVKKWYQDPVDVGSLGGWLYGIKAWNSWERHYNYILTSPAAKLGIWCKQKAMRTWMTATRYFDPIDGERDPFVLFALHLQPESSTLVRGQFFQDMLAVIRNLALSMPAGFKLYVKEHDVMFGQRPLAFFHQLKRMPNVVCVSPYESGPDLVRRAAAVATVTGTIGWEAALLGKPVIAFGHSYYAPYRGIDRVTDPTRLPGLLRERLQAFTHDEQELLTFVAAVFASIVPAGMDNLRAFLCPEDVLDAGVLADAILQRADETIKTL